MLSFTGVIRAVLLASYLASLQYAIAASPPPHTQPDAIKDAATKVANAYQQLGWFSGTVLIARQGKVIYRRSFGKADIQNDKDNTVTTKYNLGSIAKDFTRVLALQQVQAGKLNLDDTLDTFALGFSQPGAETITINHLLNHQSGFADIFTAAYRQDPLAFDTTEKKLALLRDQPLLFAPGSDSRYSNYGYVVLGAILEKISQQPFAQLLTEQIFAPLGMKQSHLSVIAGDSHQSTRYSFWYDGSLVESGITEHPGPDGGIESTVGDVHLFYRDLFYGAKLLPGENEDNIFQRVKQRWAAYGGGPGVSAAVEVYLPEQIEIVVLANTDMLVAELISGRILDFIKQGSYQPAVLPETNFAYNYYKQHGKATFYQDFHQAYEQAGYTQFLGRTINELGMQLVESEQWPLAFDMFHYLTETYADAPQAYDSLAYAYYRKGEIAKARQTFNKALQLQATFNSEYVSTNYR